MKTYKRLTIFLFFAFIAVTLWRVFEPFYAPEMTQHRDWTTYQKHEGKIKGAPTSQEDKIKLKLPDDSQAIKESQEKVRDPASVPDSHTNERQITGPYALEYQKNRATFAFTNKIAPDWKEQMAERLMRFQDENTKMYLKREKGVIEAYRGSAKYLEQVLVTFSMDDGARYSYRALVESDTGRIVETWDRTKHDLPYRFKRAQMGTLTPTGSL